MIRNLPIIPTILVIAAAGVMVALGIWQLGRAEEKAALIAEYERALEQTDVVALNEGGEENLVFRKVRIDCNEPLDWSAVAGRNARGQTGYVHRYLCRYRSYSAPEDEGVIATFAEIGWSDSPAEPSYEGGAIEGRLVRLGEDYQVISSAPLAGLEPLAEPDPGDLPNNHLAYAGQWFFFALTALLIYGFAVRSRLAKRD